MKESVKEIWIKFDSREEYSENEERLFALLDDAPGDSLVRVYDASTKGCKKLSNRSFDETQISILADAFGKDNVKFQEKKVKAERNKPYTRSIIRQIIFDDWYGVCLLCDALVCADRYELEGGEVVYIPEGGKQE